MVTEMTGNLSDGIMEDNGKGNCKIERKTTGRKKASEKEIKSYSEGDRKIIGTRNRQ